MQTTNTEKGKVRLQQEIRRLAILKQAEMVNNLLSIGATIYPSFYGLRSVEVTNDMVIQAFNNLGVDLTKVPGRKWYQFWKDDFDTKVNNGITHLHRTNTQENEAK